MDRALILLWQLRLRASLRRWGKDLRKPKGLMLTFVGLLVFVPWLASMFLTPREAFGWQPDQVRRFGPVALLAYALMSLFFASGERVLFFAPAEVDFLFPAPFSRRALLAYKVAGAVFGILLSSIFLTMAFVRSSRNPLAAYLAIVLAMLFFQLLAMAVGLASNTVAAFAVGFRRKVIVAAVLALAVATAASAGSEIFRLPPAQAWTLVESSTALKVATMPFRPFIEAYTASGIGEVAGWSAVCLAMVAAMLGAVFAFDAQYFETAAASSAKLYAQIQRMRQGGGVVPGRGPSKATRTRSRLPMLPWWGGVGPVLWRQLATASREKFRLAVIALLMSGPAAVACFLPDAPMKARGVTTMMAVITLYGIGFFSAFIAFDFRGDVDRMEELKALPVGPVPLVLGQLVTPILIFFLPGCVAFTVASPWLGARAEDFVLLATLAAASAVFLEVDNLLFLVFPTRSIQGTVADVASMGRQILLLLAKLLIGGLTIGLAALAGIVASYLTGGGMLAASLAAVVIATSVAVSLVPVLALAFLRYDVASDTPA